MRLITAILVFSIFRLFTNTTHAQAINRVKATSSSDNGGNASVQVNINNQIGTDSNSHRSEEKTETKVEIHQEGEGTSEVTINGKTWRQEGPGDISVHENSDNAGEENFPTVSEELEESDKSEVLSIESEKQSIIQKALNFFRNLFSKIFN